MIGRPVWTRRLERAWKRAPVVWLTGVRRAGKTVLARSLADAEYVNCDLPSSVERLHDPEEFLRAVGRRTLVLDEVHQLTDPSRLLKIAADAFPSLKLLATGSSTLAATRKFRDSLAGRKRTVLLVPVLVEELKAFGVRELPLRMLRGGLPPALLAPERDAEFYGEWIDSYYARDVQELFRLEKRAAFLRMFELLLRQSGGMLDLSSLAKHAGVSRPTTASWIDVFQITHAIHVLRPYARGGRREIVAQPKVYGFDTGFVCHARGWDSLRRDDYGPLWEHLVLDTLLSVPVPDVFYWRDKQQREIDFVVPRGRDAADAIECKWSPDAFETRGLSAFRSSYPRGRNLLVTPKASTPSRRRLDGFDVEIVPVESLRTIYGGV